MQLTVLGSGTVVPTLERGSSAYLVETGGERLVFDFGNGAVHALMKAGVDPRDLSHLFISHVHPDHTADLVPYLFACNYAPGWAGRRPLEVHGPVGFRQFFLDLQVPYRWLAPRGWDCAVFEHGRDQIRGEGWTVQTFPVEHGDLEALAFRVEAEGKVLCYSGDTCYCPGLVEAAGQADLFLCECSVPDDHPQVEGHLRSSQVALAARQARARRVLLTHLYPVEADLVAEVARGYPGPVEAARDGARYPV